MTLSLARVTPLPAVGFCFSTVGVVRSSQRAAHPIAPLHVPLVKVLLGLMLVCCQMRACGALFIHSLVAFDVRVFYSLVRGASVRCPAAGFVVHKCIFVLLVSVDDAAGHSTFVLFLLLQGLR